MENKIKSIAKELASVTIKENREFIENITKGLNDEQLRIMCMTMAIIAVKNNATEIQKAIEC